MFREQSIDEIEQVTYNVKLSYTHCSLELCFLSIAASVSPKWIII